jgi:hypothetical protein
VSFLLHYEHQQQQAAEHGVTLTGSDMTTPRPRNEREAKPARPESNSDWARMPPSLNVVFSSGASER